MNKHIPLSINLSNQLSNLLLLFDIQTFTRMVHIPEYPHGAITTSHSNPPRRMCEIHRINGLGYIGNDSKRYPRGSIIKVALIRPNPPDGEHIPVIILAELCSIRHAGPLAIG